MSVRVPLDKTAFTKRTDGTLRLAPGRQLYVYKRDTKTEATGYTSQDGSTKVTYPLTADKNGRFNAWYPPGSYDLYDPVDDETQPWEAVIGVDSALVAVVLEAPINVQHPEFGATGDGSTDDVPAIQAALNKAGNAGGGEVFIPPGTYSLKTRSAGLHCLEVHDNTRLIGAGVGATVLRAHDDLPNNTSLIWSEESYIEIAHLSIDGNKQRFGGGINPANSENEGIDFRPGSHHVWIHDVHIYDVGADAIDLDGIPDTVISNFVIENSGGHAIHSGGNAPRMVVMNGITRNNAYQRAQPGVTNSDTCAGIDVNGPGVLIVGVVSYQDVRGISVLGGEGVVIANCVVYQPSADTPKADAWGVGVVNGSVVAQGVQVVRHIGQTAPGFYVGGSTSRIQLSGCRTYLGLGPALHLDGQQLRVVGVDGFVCAGGRGALVEETHASGRVNFSACTLIGDAGFHGLEIAGGGHTHVKGCLVRNEGGAVDGVRIAGGARATILGSTIESASNDGSATAVRVASTAGSWLISSSDISSNFVGVRVEEASGGTIRDCDIEAGGAAGVDLRGPAGEVLIDSVRIKGSPTNGIRFLDVSGAPSDCRVLNCDVPSIAEDGTGHIIKNNVINGVFVSDGTTPL